MIWLSNFFSFYYKFLFMINLSYDHIAIYELCVILNFFQVIIFLLSREERLQTLLSVRYWIIFLTYWELISFVNFSSILMLRLYNAFRIIYLLAVYETHICKFDISSINVITNLIIVTYLVKFKLNINKEA